MKKIFSTMLAVAALAVAVLAPPAAVANDDLWNSQFGGRFIMGLYPGSKSNPTTATSVGSGATGTATINNTMGTVTTPSLTTAAQSTYTLTLTNSYIAAGDIVIPVAGNGSNTAGTPTIDNATVSAGSVQIVLFNDAQSAAFNGTVTISFYVFKSAYAQ